MCWMIRDIVAIFGECVNLLWCPRLFIFENFTEFIELCWGKLRRPSAAEAWTESLYATFIPRVSPHRRVVDREIPTRLPASFRVSPW